MHAAECEQKPQHISTPTVCRERPPGISVFPAAISLREERAVRRPKVPLWRGGNYIWVAYGFLVCTHYTRFPPDVTAKPSPWKLIILYVAFNSREDCCQIWKRILLCREDLLSWACLPWATQLPPRLNPHGRRGEDMVDVRWVPCSYQLLLKCYPMLFQLVFLLFNIHWNTQWICFLHIKVLIY